MEAPHSSWEPSLPRKGWRERCEGKEGRSCCRAGSQGQILKDLLCHASGVCTLIWWAWGSQERVFRWGETIGFAF